MLFCINIILVLQEALEKERLVHYNENQDLARMVHLHQSIQNQRRKHIEEVHIPHCSVYIHAHDIVYACTYNYMTAYMYVHVLS